MRLSGAQRWCMVSIMRRRLTQALPVRRLTQLVSRSGLETLMHSKAALNRLIVRVSKVKLVRPWAGHACHAC